MIQDQDIFANCLLVSHSLFTHLTSPHAPILSESSPTGHYFKTMQIWHYKYAIASPLRKLGLHLTIISVD